MPSNTSRSLIARIAAHSRWAGESDRSAATAAGRAAARTALDQRLIAKFGIDLDQPGAETRLEHARRAHFATLALRSAEARSRKRRAK